LAPLEFGIARFIATKDRIGPKLQAICNGKTQGALGQNYVETTVSGQHWVSRILVSPPVFAMMSLQHFGRSPACTAP
jgi:hypothetical protein